MQLRISEFDKGLCNAWDSFPREEMAGIARTCAPEMTKIVLAERTYSDYYSRNPKQAILKIFNPA